MPSREATRLIWRRLLWFVLLWAAGVLFVSALGLLIRALLKA